MIRAFHRAGLVFVLALTCVEIAAAGDWASWRGPAQTGVAYERGTPDSAKDVLWRAPFGGRSTPVILRGRVYGIGLAGEGVMEQERVFCLDLATGSPIWERRFNVFHTDIPNTRVGWSSLVADPETGNVYAFGVEGLLIAFDRDGKILWSHSLTETAGRISGYGGRVMTPIVDEDRLVISFLNSSYDAHAVGAHRYLALDKRTGAMLWWGAPGGRPEDTTYSIPVVSVIDGRRLLIGGNADGGIYAMLARTGEKVWGFQLSQRGINSSVVVDGYRVYATHSEENRDSTAMGRVVCIDGRGKGDVTKTHEIWRQDGVEAGYASPLLHDGRLYTMTNSGLLNCFDANTGKDLWTFTAGRSGKGSPIWADGKIYVAPVNSRFLILQDAGTSCKRLDMLPIKSEGQGQVEMFGSPAVSEGKVLFFTTKEMICLGRRDAPHEDLPVPSLPAEPPADPAAAPATLLVRPCEVLLKPGDTAKFRAVGYDAMGRMLKPVEAQWSTASVRGTVAPDGGFHAADAPAGSTGVVTAKVGSLTAQARVRIVPPLPIREDFESYKDGDVVNWWIGVSKTKYAIETLDGTKVLKKIADDRGPIFNRSHAFLTPPIAPGYSVRADVMGRRVEGKLGDVGVINDRYNLELMGAVQRLRVVSWVPAPRFEKRIEFPWKPDQWYSTRLDVAVADGKAQVKAKVWPRGQAEPQAWTIEAEDPQPNLEGAAGLYAYSMAPLYFDNVQVVRER
jgi:outer membrane protein assembly factor BamB